MKRKLSLVCLLLGGLLLAAAAGLAGYFLVEDRAASAASVELTEQIVETVAPMQQEMKQAESLPASRQVIPDYVLNPEIEMPRLTVDGYDCVGVVEIPTLGKKLPVISQWSYEALRISPCRYDGSAYTGDLIIAAHNYISHFADLSRLQPGERVTFTDVEGNVFAYDVTEVTTVTPDAVEELKSGDWDLTLFTCTFGNSYRVVVRCRLV